MGIFKSIRALTGIVKQAKQIQNAQQREAGYKPGLGGSMQRVAGLTAYRVANDYMVPDAAQIGVGLTLPVKVDPRDQAKVAIDWEHVPNKPVAGQIRPAGPTS